jgi:fructokinase
LADSFKEIPRHVTIGTGVGVGLIAAGKPILGCHHPELGHVRIARFPGDLWPGNCRFHGDCVEGLVSGPAIQARVGHSAADLSADSPIWESIAYVLGQLAQTLLLAVAPQRILIGGGVVNTRPHLFPRIRHYLATSLNGYLDIEEVTRGLDDFLGPPGLGASAGPLGALALAADTLSG